MAARRTSKRANNHGSVYQRKDGQWVGAITLPSTGKRKVFYGTSRLVVEQKLTKAFADLGQGIEPADRQTLQVFLSSWLEHVVKPNLRPKTYRFYEQQVRVHLIPALGRTEIAKLTPMQVQALFNQKLQDGLSAASVDAMRRTLRAALNQAIKWNLVQRNVATLVDPPRASSRQIQPLDQASLKRLLVAMDGDRLEALYLTAIATGLRQGELLGLRWSDVDLDGHSLSVRGQLQEVDGCLTITPTKTLRSQRTLVLPASVAESLRRHKLRQHEEKFQAGDRWNEIGLVFTTKLGTALYARNVFRQFQRLLERSGLEPMRFHDLRHTAATLMLAQGVDVRTIMEVLGHSQISLTLNTYSHVIPALKRSAADRMEEVLKEASEG